MIVLTGVSYGSFGRDPHLTVYHCLRACELWTNHCLDETDGVEFYDAVVTARPTCLVLNVGTSFVFPCHLGGLVIRRWSRWIRWTDPPSTFVTVLYPWALVSAPALVLDSVLFLAIDTRYC